MSKKRTNPHKRPASVADVEKAKRQAQQFSINAAMAIFFTVMRDKEGYGTVRLQRVWSAVNDLSDSIAQGYVSVPDLIKTLETESGIIFNKGE